MLEIIVILVVGSIIYSTFQGVRRGKVSTEERENNPTLVESMAKAAESAGEAVSKASAHAQRYHLQTMFELEHLKWLKTFERIVSKALDLSASRVAHEEELDSNPRLREIYNEILGTHKNRAKADVDDLKAEPDWVKGGPPSAPQPGSDPEMTQIYKGSFEKHIKRHREFVDETRERLRRNPRLRKDFEKLMIGNGLKSLLQDYFTDTDISKPSPSANSPSGGVWNAFRHLQLKDPLHSSSIMETKRTRLLVSKPDPAMGEISAANTGAAGTAPSAGAIPPAGTSGGRIIAMPSSMTQTKEIDGVEIQARREAEKEACTEERKLEIRALAKELGIPHLVHFTRCDNLPSILHHGLLSVARCDAQGIQGIRNDGTRLDGQPNGISTSIAFPNYRMFYKYRQMDPAADWAVMILSPKLLWEKECGFYRYNAADSRMRNLPWVKMTTAQAFREMFETSDEPRDTWLRRFDPSDTQAEVMVYEMIEPRFIEAVAFETRSIAVKWAHVLGGIESIHAGPGKGLFASRANVRLS